MKNSVNSNLNLGRYRWLGFSIIIIAIAYVLSDYIEWYIYKSKFILGLNQMPLYRRFLTDLYIVLLAYGGYQILKLENTCWYTLTISATSIIPSFFIIPRVWGVLYYTNWFEDLPFFLWYLLSIVLVFFLIIKRNDFGIDRWVGRFFLILVINIAIRYLHEVIFYSIANA